MQIIKCTNNSCEAIKYGQSNQVAIPDKAGKVTLLSCGSKVEYQDWMKGICLDCITGIKEFEGEMSETSSNDYMSQDYS
jgi:hypothetical protein